MCERHDIGIAIHETSRGSEGSEPLEPLEPRETQIFVYDNYPGGIGFSEPLFRMHDDLLRDTHRLIAECDCEAGCPVCVGPVGNTGRLAKTAALRILELLIERLPRSVPEINTTSDVAPREQIA